VGASHEVDEASFTNGTDGAIAIHERKKIAKYSTANPDLCKLRFELEEAPGGCIRCVAVCVLDGKGGATVN
jgi:hypothetical protein